MGIAAELAASEGPSTRGTASTPQRSAEPAAAIQCRLMPWTAQRIAEHCRGRIESGQLLPGTKLLAQDLIDFYGANSQRVATAMKVLQAENCVVFQPGKGYFVTDQRDHAAARAEVRKMLHRCGYTPDQVLTVLAMLDELDANGASPGGPPQR